MANVCLYVIFCVLFDVQTEVLHEVFHFIVPVHKVPGLFARHIGDRSTFLLFHHIHIQLYCRAGQPLEIALKIAEAFFCNPVFLRRVEYLECDLFLRPVH